MAKTPKGVERLLNRAPGEKFLITHKDIDSLITLVIVWMYGGDAFAEHEIVFVEKSWDGTGATDDDFILDMEVKCPDGVVRGDKGRLGPGGVRHSAADLVARRFCSTGVLEILEAMLRLVDAYDAYGDQFYLKLMPNLPEGYGQALISTGLIDHYRSNWGPMSDDAAFNACYHWLYEWIEVNSKTSLADLLNLIPELDRMVLEITAELMREENYLPRLSSSNPLFLPAHNEEWLAESVAELRRGYLIPTMVRRTLGKNETEWVNWLDTLARTGLLYEFHACKVRNKNKRDKVRKEMKAKLHKWFERQSETLEWMLRLQLRETGNQVEYLDHDVVCFVEPIEEKQHIVVAAMKRLGTNAYIARKKSGAVGNIRLRGDAHMDDPRILEVYFEAGEKLQKDGGNLFYHTSHFMTSTNDDPSSVDLVKLSERVELVVGESLKASKTA